MPPRRWSKFPAYVSAEERRARAAAAAVRLGKQAAGHDPIRIQGRDITTTFWGTAWCQNLQSYADFAYRLDRGRSYVRSGAVVDLKITAGQVAARVSGTRLYTVEIAISALDRPRWQEIAQASSGRIGSLVALLRGELHDEVMRAVTDRDTGLFPKPGQMQMRCDCPDSAILCKHVAATLYGVGARLDTSPELLFRLRGVDPQDLLEQATATLASASAAPAARLSSTIDDLGALFGIELADSPPAEAPPPPRAARKSRRKPQRKAKTPARAKAGPGSRGKKKRPKS